MFIMNTCSNLKNGHQGNNPIVPGKHGESMLNTTDKQDNVDMDQSVIPNVTSHYK